MTVGYWETGIWTWCMDSLSGHPSDRPGHQFIKHLPRYILEDYWISLKSHLCTVFPSSPRSQLLEEEGGTDKSRGPQVEVCMVLKCVHESHS